MKALSITIILMMLLVSFRSFPVINRTNPANSIKRSSKAFGTGSARHMINDPILMLSELASGHSGRTRSPGCCLSPYCFSSDCCSSLDCLSSCCSSIDFLLPCCGSPCYQTTSTSSGGGSDPLCSGCVIPIYGGSPTYFNPVADPRMKIPTAAEIDALPESKRAIVFEFCPCWGEKSKIPTLVFDPAVFGNGGVVALPHKFRMIFKGNGIVQVKDGVNFNLGGSGDPVPASSDEPQLITENFAVMRLDTTSVSQEAYVTGIGRFYLRSGGMLLLDSPGHLIFGTSSADYIEVIADDVGSIVLNGPVGASDAFKNTVLTFQLGQFDLLFLRQSSLRIIRGVVEINSNNGVNAAGLLSTLLFEEGSCLQVQKVGTESGVLRFSPNFLDANVAFNNRTGEVHGGGNMQYLAFNGAGTRVVNSVVQLQEHFFEVIRPMVEVFMELGWILVPENQPTQEEPSDARILARLGVSDALMRAALFNPLPAPGAELAAFKPSSTGARGDGSLVALLAGDHDVSYDGPDIIGQSKSTTAQPSYFFRIYQSDVRQQFLPSIPRLQQGA
jgi:hypothetical protein